MKHVDLGSHILRLIRQHADAHPVHSWGTTMAYNPSTHMCKVRLDPAGDTEWLPIATPYPGLAAPIPPGTVCRVAYEHGAPTAIIGLYHSDGNPVPAGDLTINGDAYVGSLTVGGAFALNPSRVAGAPTSGTHAQGELAMDSAGALHVCVASGTPGIWKSVTLA